MNRNCTGRPAYILAAVLIISGPACSREKFVPEKEFISVSGSVSEKGDDNPYWDWSDKYPGMVSSRIERVKDFPVTVKGGYSPLVIAPYTPVLQSTGLFVPSGEHVKIEVPAEAIGLNWQIGLGYPLAEGQFRKRFTDVTSKGTLLAGENIVSSYFGGYLYFFYDADNVPGTEVTLKITGAVPSEDFVLGETLQSSWLAAMQEKAALLASPADDPDSMAFLGWTELHSRHLILTSGISEMTALHYPDKVMQTYDMLVETAYKWRGDEIDGQPKIRLFTDIQLPDAGQTAQSSGAKVEFYGKYPIGFLRGEDNTSFVAEKKLLNLSYVQGQTDVNEGSNFPKLVYGFGDAFTEAWRLGYYFQGASEKMFHMYYTYFTQGVRPGSVTVDFADVVNILNSDIERWKTNSLWSVAMLKNDNTITFFMQLSQYCGWPLYTYLNRRARDLGFHEIESELDSQEYFDFLAMSVSEYIGKNICPFFELWKCPVSTSARQYIANFPSFSKDEVFWTSYDPSVLPSFSEREPDLSYADRRPSFNLVKHLTPSDEKAFWRLSGELIDKDTDEIRSSNNSDDNPNWQKIFDNDVNTSATPLGDVNTANGRVTHEQHRPVFTMDFMRPIEHVIENEEGEEIAYEYGSPHSFNALMISNAKVDFMVNYIFNMEYLDENDVWRSTSPNEFYLYHKNEFAYYSFDRLYTAKKFRYELQSICPSTGDVARVVLNDIDWITIDTE